MKSLGLVFSLIFYIFSSFCFAEKLHLPIGVYEEHYEVFKRALASGKCPSARDYPIENNQVLAEFLLFCEALELGGVAPEFELKPFPTYTRLLRQLDSPALAALGFGVWRRDLDDEHFYISSPIVPAGKFVKGIYALPFSEMTLSACSRDDVKQFTALTNAGWTVDEEAIKCIGSKIKNARTYMNMFPMIAAKRADYLITTFPAGQNLNITFYDVTLTPVVGVKVVLKDSLHFAINKKYAESEIIFNALEVGLKILNDNGTLKQINERLGLSNPLVDSWQNIGCQ